MKRMRYLTNVFKNSFFKLERKSYQKSTFTVLPGVLNKTISNFFQQLDHNTPQSLELHGG